AARSSRVATSRVYSSVPVATSRVAGLMSTATVFVASSAIAPGIDLKLIGVHAAEAHVLGVRVDCIDMESALKRIEALANAGGHHLVATVNPEFVMRARSDREFARVLGSADLCLPDGSGVVWAARRQEMWIDRAGRRVNVPVSIGVGGSFDYLTGRVTRAPRWMRSAGLEWLFRLVRQPWRLRRMAVLPVFAWRVLRES